MHGRRITIYLITYLARLCKNWEEKAETKAAQEFKTRVDEAMRQRHDWIVRLS